LPLTRLYVGRNEPVAPAAILVSSLPAQYGRDAPGRVGAIQTSSDSWDSLLENGGAPGHMSSSTEWHRPRYRQRPRRRHRLRQLQRAFPRNSRSAERVSPTPYQTSPWPRQRRWRGLLVPTLSLEWNHAAHISVLGAVPIGAGCSPVDVSSW